MKVLLKEDVESLGYAGEVKDVANGYGRNYLLPRGLAVLATKSAMNQAEAWREKAEARRAALRAEYDLLSERIEAVSLEFFAKAGDSGKLYGSVTNIDITDALSEALGTEIDRRKVDGGPLRMLGEHSVVVRLDVDHHPAFTVTVRNEDADAEAEAEAAEAEAEADVADEAEAIAEYPEDEAELVSAE